MKPVEVKQALNDTIQAMSECKWFFSVRPGKDNTRSRKFPFRKVISAILAFRGGTLNREIMDFFGLDPSIGTSSAFIQRRAKILPEAFECLFQHFTAKVDEDSRFRGLRLLAVDGSDLQIAANPNDPDSYFPGANGQKAYNLLHLNAMYDLLQCIYLDAVLQKRRNCNESSVLTDMVERSDIEKVLLLADRGYES
ncbi:MAG: transposase [Candidatus Limivicinus sp.]|nr:transposase [Candidatus Limivicinus sp.]